MSLSQEKRKKVISLLRRKYPGVRPALRHKSAIQLLVSTILSAQCTDARVNKVTPALFKKYKTAKDFANADIADLQRLVKSTGFYRNKAKNIKACCKKIVEEHKGRVPQKMEELVHLPGVARKTANCILWGWYDKSEGVVVDTHVKRVTHRLGFTDHTNPVKVEKDLMKIIPKRYWGSFSMEIIMHGREICKSQRPQCDKCFLNKLCPSAFKFKHFK